MRVTYFCSSFVFRDTFFFALVDRLADVTMSNIIVAFEYFLARIFLPVPLTQCLFGRRRRRARAFAAVAKISIIAEIGEDEKEGDVDDEGHINIRPRLMTRAAVRLDHVHVVGDSTADDDLQNLNTRHRHGHEFRRPVAVRAPSEIRVHGRVDAEIHPTKPTTGRRQRARAVPTEDQRAGVVVPMQETHRLLT